MEMKRVVIYSLVLVLILVTGYTLSGPYIDKSQTVHEARKSGAPVINKVWTLKEYELFYVYLASLPDDVDYPMLSSEKSSELFNRFINSLDKVVEKPLEDSLVFTKIIKLKNISHKILKLYVDKDIKTQKYTDEIAHLYGVQIQMFLYMHKVAKRIMSSIKEDDSSLKTRIKGLELMEQGAVVQVSIILDLLSESSSLKDNKVLIRYFEQYVPELLSFFDVKRRETIEERVIEVSDKVSLSSAKILLNCISN
jgi:replicative superfamily II helicase